MIDEAILKEELKTIIDPKTRTDILSSGYIQDVEAQGNDLTLWISDDSSYQAYHSQLQTLIKSHIQDKSITVEFKTATTKLAASGLSKVKHILAISSCKGGVGKSSVSVNLAYSLASQGHKVGIFDADIYGPSLPTMVKLDNYDLKMDGPMLAPKEHKGVKLMSFGYTQDDSSNPAIMRGPMVSQIIQQLVTGTAWGDLDYLLIDMPPGTGDIQLTLGQIIPLTAAVIVTTPQHISFIDVVKGIEMFDALKVPTVSVVENMSYFTCDSCDKKHQPFGKGAKERLVKEFGYKHTFTLPIVNELSQSCDEGDVFVLKQANHELSTQFSELATAINTVISVDKDHVLEPPKVDVDERGILVLFEGQDPQYLKPKDLRLKCRCARCEEEFSGVSRLNAEDIPDTIKALSMNPVGNYALGINWSDNHSSIYPYDSLREFIKTPVS